MSNALVPGLRVDRNARICKIRELPIQGQICVGLGESVNPDQIVARTQLPGDLHILRIAERLGIEPFEVVNSIKRLNLSEGSVISNGQLVCEHSGLFGLLKSRFLSPISGTIELISEKVGHLVVREQSKDLSLDAYVRGQVVEIVPNKSVTIETSGAFIQGIFGIGGERQGIIKILDVAPDHKIVAQNIPANSKNCILVGGTLPDQTALKKAAEGGAVGLVTAAIDDQALSSYLGYQLGIALTGDEKVPMTVIITEGFGHLAFSQRSLDLFKEFNGFPASINGATQVRAGAIRPEIIIAHEKVSTTVLHDTASLQGGLSVGARIRIVRVPFFGLEAEVIELPNQLQTIETGAQTRVLKAKLSDGKVVVVPRANVEIV